MKNNNDMIVTRLAELVSASTQKSKETLKQVQCDGLLVAPSLRAFEKCMANYCLNHDTNKINKISKIFFCGRHSTLDAVSPDICRWTVEIAEQARNDETNNHFTKKHTNLSQGLYVSKNIFFLNY